MITETFLYALLKKEQFFCDKFCLAKQMVVDNDDFTQGFNLQLAKIFRLPNEFKSRAIFQ